MSTAPSQDGVAWGVGGHKGCPREAPHGGERRGALWLMCPIKLLQTLPRQLLPAGPWVQIGSVSLPRVVSVGPESCGQFRQRTAGLLPLAQPGPPTTPSNLCSLQYPTGFPGPVRHPDPHPWQSKGPPEPSLSFCRYESFTLYRGSSLRKPLSGHPADPCPPLIPTIAQ